MVDADKNDNTSSSTGSDADKSKGTEALNAQLSEVQESLRKMNAQMEATQNAIAEANRKQKPDEDDDNVYDPAKFAKKIDRDFDTKINQRLKEERAKDMMVYNLAQEYPEIHTDSALRKAIAEAQSSIPASMRETADGYEMAVLKAVTKVGLVAKSRRQSVDDDTSVGGSRGSRSAPKSKVKVSDKTLLVAQLLGRDIEDPKVLKGLEEAANRNNYTKYE